MPTDEEIAKSRANAKRLAGLAKARAAKAAKTGATAAPVAPSGEAPKRDRALLLAGCRQLVRLFWWIARFGAWVAGGKMEPLSEKDLDEGAKEALPLAERFGFLAVLLGFVGFPIWLCDRVVEKFRWLPKKTEASAPSNVHALPPKENAG
ncbi:MAG: hypothetical protein ACYCWW_00155 [Deltaproteobacteria bacterium]